MKPGEKGNDRVDPVEKGVIAIAVFSSILHLGLIAFAAIRLGIGVPTCVTEVKPFGTGTFYKHGPKRFEAHILAKMWAFEPNLIRIPTGAVLEIFLASKDVNHGFHINGTNVNLMAVPLAVNYARVKFDRPGKYPIVCHEYCGTGHQSMNGVIEVADENLTGEAEGLPTDPANPEVKASISLGRKIIETKGCIACHSLDGKVGVGPSFKGLWGKTETLMDETSVVVDDAYIRESILDPKMKIVKGFGPVMPNLPVSDDEIHEISEYLKTLK